MKTFVARIRELPNGKHYVILPEGVRENPRFTHCARVRGKLDGVAYRSLVMKWKGDIHLDVSKRMMESAGVRSGSSVRLTIQHDPEPLPTDEVPPLLARALARNKGARAEWEGLRPSQRRQHVRYVLSAKKRSTAERRVTEIVSLLSARNAIPDIQAIDLTKLLRPLRADRARR